MVLPVCRDLRLQPCHMAEGLGRALQFQAFGRICGQQPFRDRKLDQAPDWFQRVLLCARAPAVEKSRDGLPGDRPHLVLAVAATGWRGELAEAAQDRPPCVLRGLGEAACEVLMLEEGDHRMINGARLSAAGADLRQCSAGALQQRVIVLHEVLIAGPALEGDALVALAAEYMAQLAARVVERVDVWKF